MAESAGLCGGIAILMGGAPVGISWLLVAGVIRFVGNICLGEEVGLEGPVCGALVGLV